MKTLKRTLVSTVNSILVNGSATVGCLATTAFPITLSVSPAVANSTYQWVVPTGFIATPSTGSTLTLTSASAGATGNISVTTDGCPSSPAVQVSLTVSGQQGCTYTITGYGSDPALTTFYEVTRTGTSATTCLPATPGCPLGAPAPNALIRYDWVAYNSSNVPIPNATASSSCSSVQFPVAVPRNVGNKIEVHIINSTTGACLDAWTTKIVVRPAPPGPSPSSPQPAQLRGTGSLDPNELQAFPSPATGALYVELPAAKMMKAASSATLTLTDLTGRVQKTATLKGTSDTVLDVHGLAEGVYQLKAELSDGTVLKRTVQVRH